MSEITLELDEHPKPEDFRVVLDGVRGFNRAQTGNERPRPVACYLRDDAGQIVGGVQGNLCGRSTHIDALWVDDNYRGRGYGAKLMKTIEDYAAAHGYPLIYLETASFQALPFYQSLGYVVSESWKKSAKDTHCFFCGRNCLRDSDLPSCRFQLIKVSCLWYFPPRLPRKEN